jgi:hypothetical protein
MIVANNLVEGSFVFDPGVDSAQARVYRQEPEAGEDIFVREGSMINLWLGNAPVDPYQPNHPNLPE